MKKAYLSIAASVTLASFAFMGCNGSKSASGTTGTLSLNPTLENVEYACGNLSGVTNASGEYSYNDGDKCTFTIGGKELTATAGKKLTIAQIAEENDGVSEDVLSSFIIAKMSESTGVDYKIGNLPESFSLPKNIKGNTKTPLKFDSIENLKTSLGNESELISKVENFNTIYKEARVNISFREIDVPLNEDTQSTQQSSNQVVVNGETQNINYKTILATGHKDTTNEIFGLSKNYKDEVITFKDGSPYVCNGTNDGVGSGLDYTSFLNKNGNLYMVSQFECQVGSFYMTQLEQNPKTGELSAKEGTLKFISQKDEFGGFVHCAGQRTPWESHLSSEEYEPDARAVLEGADPETGLTGSKYYDEVAKYWGGDIKMASPYYYGWTPEITVSNDGEATYSKHYAMGRFSHELSYVMPDRKTVYLSDDGTNVGLYMYVADKAGDLSAGTLYAAKWNQTSEVGVGAGKADITWINLGHANNSEIRTYLDKDSNVQTNDALKFTDIFETATGDAGTCPTGFNSINTSASHECLKIKDGMDKAASRLETRRYAAIKGATTEFRKEEGITFDKKSGKLYVAMSSVERGMEDNAKSGTANTKYDIGGNNDIKVAYNYCGAIYSMDVNKEVAKDTEESIINSEYVVMNMNSILEGVPNKYSEASTYYGNSCDVNGISNPDNVTFLDNSDVLMIGEDTSKHKNNAVWEYNVKTKELTRAFTTPLDAETTSPFWYTDLKNGFGYLSVVTQHPMEDVKGAKAIQKESTIGYVGPFKNLTKIK